MQGVRSGARKELEEKKSKKVNYYKTITTATITIPQQQHILEINLHKTTYNKELHFYYFKTIFYNNSTQWHR